MQILISFLAVVLGSSLAMAQATLTIEVPNIKEAKGDLLVAVYKGANGFPDQPDKAAGIQKLKPLVGKNVIQFNLEPGNYAVAVVHDVNGNGEVDLNGFGIPKEPIGFSNDPVLLGKPTYEDTNFEVVAPATTKAIKMKSFGFKRIR